MKKILAVLVIAAVLFFVLIQLFPYGRRHTNPGIGQEPAWDKPETRLLAQRACFDCHSNETFWPWYSNIAPFSWLIQRDVDEGRSKLNFSTWGQGEQETEEVGETIQEGEMPPAYYILLHPDANLSVAEKNALIDGLVASGAGGRGSSSEEGDD
jgi:hypothetical protein